MKIKGHIKDINFSKLPRPTVNEFRVLDAYETIIDDQSVMRLKLSVTSDEKHTFEMIDEIREDDVYKIDLFSRAIGIRDVFGKRELIAEQCIGAVGKVRLFLQRKLTLVKEEFSSTLNGVAYMAGSNGYIPKDQS